MREDFPSATAMAVALARGIASLPGRRRAPAEDPVAASMLPGPVGRALEGLTPLAARAPVQLALRLGSLGLADHVALRTAAIDEVVERTCAAGTPQVVILGAGLDARAYRLDALSSTAVFEVDHPATQRFKRSRVRELSPRAGALTHVAVDFAREDLGTRLAEEGHDAAAPTLWIWEGVFMYLPPEAGLRSLSAMAARSCAGSQLAMTYGTPLDQPWIRRLRGAVELGFAALGEPLVHLASTSDTHRMIEGRGWKVTGDTSPRDWRDRFDYGNARLLFIDEHLLVAERA